MDNGVSKTTWRARTSGALAAALLAGVVLSSVAAAATGAFNASDFKVKAVTASFGAPETASVELDGTLSRRAFDAGLRPNVHFVLSARVTCAPASDPTHATTTTLAIDSQIGGFAIDGPIGYTTRPGGAMSWRYVVTFPAVPFDDFDAYLFCPPADGPSVLQGFSLVEAKGLSWLAPPGISPEPGTTVYAFDATPGSVRLKPQRAGY